MANTAKLNELLKILNENPNARTYLNVIALAEGTAGHGKQDGYDVGYGYKINPDQALTKHPNISRPFTEKGGKKNRTTAEGRYQIRFIDFNEIQQELGLKDFGPLSQDVAALRRIEKASPSALRDVLAGRFDAASSKLGGVWVSLPSGGAGGTQGKHSWAALHKIYEKAANWKGVPSPLETQTAQYPAASGGATDQLLAAEYGPATPMPGQEDPVQTARRAAPQPELLLVPPQEMDFSLPAMPDTIDARSVFTTPEEDPSRQTASLDFTLPPAMLGARESGPRLADAAASVGALPVSFNGQRTMAIPETPAEARAFQKFDTYNEDMRGKLVNAYQMLNQANASKNGEKPMFSQYPTMFDQELLDLIDTV